MTDMPRLELRERILECTACDLHLKGRGPVPFSGPTPALFAIVGEAPGEEEDKKGRPFLGRAGQLLRRHLVEANLDPDLAFICNTVSCWPQGTPRPASIGACRQNLWDQLALSRATRILALGSVALSVFRSDLRITAAHGQTFSLPDGRTVFTTFHPAAALRRTDWDDSMAADLLRFGQAINQGSWTGLTLDLCVMCRRSEEEMEAIRFDGSGLPYCEKCWPATPEARAEAGLPPPGAPPAPRLNEDEAVRLVKAHFPGTAEIEE